MLRFRTFDHLISIVGGSFIRLVIKFADQTNAGTGRNTANTMDLLSTSSAEFEDVSTTESEYEREYTNLESGLLPSQPARSKFVYFHQNLFVYFHQNLFSPLNFLVKFFGCSICKLYKIEMDMICKILLLCF